MKVFIHELAKNEFDEAIEWYELQSQGLGERFKNSVIQQIEKVKKNPTWFVHEQDNIYKAYIPKFPYKIIFSIEKDNINIWAIAHLHRKPQYWQYR